MPDEKRFEHDPAEGPDADKKQEPSQQDRRIGGSFPPFDDPAFSPQSAEPPPTEPNGPNPPRDTEFAGHPEFSQDAAKNAPPALGAGNSEPVDETTEKARHSEGVAPPAYPASDDVTAIEE